MKQYDVCVIGLGRVGLPFALSLEENGFSVSGVDRNNKKLQKSIKKGKMPFYEPGYNELIKKSKIKVFSSKKYPLANYYIITVGTPLKQHIEADITNVFDVVKSLIKQQNGNIENSTIILRSTLTPNTTSSIKDYIEQHSDYVIGKNFGLGMCPERLAEGKAYKELHELPQIVGTEDELSRNEINKLFQSFGIKIFDTSYVEAELAKLLTNGYRYINFAISNYFSHVASKFGVDIFNLLKVMNTDYPRNSGLKTPGLSSGSCLRKDWGLINEWFPESDIFLHAYKVNEHYPIEQILKLKEEIKGKTIGVLGYTMKADSDDTRDSLVPKMIRYIERFVPKNIIIHEPYLPEEVDDEFNNMQFINSDLDTVIEQSDIIFIAINHSKFLNLNKSKMKNKIIVDLWGVMNRQLINKW